MSTTHRLQTAVVSCLALVALAVARPSAISGANVRQASPAATPAAVVTNSGRYLPAAEAFGEGWTRVATNVFDADPAVFLDAASAIYVGPSGARVVVSALTNLTGRAAVQRSWEFVGKAFDESRFEVTGPKDDDREEELATLPLPEGCVDVRRIDGRDPLYFLPGAITQCAIDPDVTVFVIVAGTIDGLSGYEASDHVATEAARAGRK